LQWSFFLQGIEFLNSCVAPGALSLFEPSVRICSMTDRGDYIAVEMSEAARDLPTLLEAVERDGRTLRIFRDGTAIADVSPIRAIPPDPLAQHPEIANVTIAPDAFAPADAQDWPSDATDSSVARATGELPMFPELTGVVFNIDPTAPL
jgi:antitoxin (DNA-binding transcriptional repressor) of toxin-antitoxin stability system